MNIQQNYSLKKLNTFHIDASAKYFLEVASIEDILEVLSANKYLNQSKLILGGGSNLLFTKDFDGIVIKNNLKGINLINEDSH